MTYRNANGRRARSYRRSGQAWNPSRIPSLVAWWHGGDLTGAQTWTARVGSATFGTAQSGATTGAEATDPSQSVGVSTSFDGGDYWEIADNSAADFGTNDSFTAIVVVSDLGPAPATSTFMAKASAFTGQPGWGLGFTSTIVFGRISDGTTNIVSPTGSRPASKATIAMVRNADANTLGLFVNGVSVGTATSDTSSGTLANAEAWRFGRLSGAGVSYGVFTGYGFLLCNSALSPAVLLQLTSWYGV